MRVGVGHRKESWMKNGIVVLAVAVLTAPGSACTREGKTLLGPVSERVEVFIVAQGLPTVRGYDEVLVDSERDLLLFRVRYGEASDCLPAGCVYPSAFGLVLGSRIGWVVPPETLGEKAIPFDVLPEDSPVFGEEFLVAVRHASADGYDAVRVMLARDEHTAERTLFLIASSLSTDDGPVEIGKGLVENATARSSFEVLSRLVRSTMRITKWREVHLQAWDLLEPFLPPVESLRAEGVVERLSDDRLMGIASLHNPTDRPFVAEYAGSCAIALLAYDDPTYGGPPRWDQHRWQNTRIGGCKWFPGITEVGVGEVAKFATPGVSDSIILGDSLPTGAYWLAIRVRILQPADTTLVIPGGEVELSR